MQIMSNQLYLHFMQSPSKDTQYTGIYTTSIFIMYTFPCIKIKIYICSTEYKFDTKQIKKLFKLIKNQKV